MEENEPLDPVSVRALGAERVVLETHDCAHLREQFELGVRDEAIPDP
jgi:hypothetical protein